MTPSPGSSPARRRRPTPRARRLLNSPWRPTAVFATDNESTRRIFLAAKTEGFKVPDRVSLLGFDDLDWTVMVEPQISVVAQSPLLMGRVAGERLFARIKGDRQPKRRIVLPTRLIIRASTGTQVGTGWGPMNRSVASVIAGSEVTQAPGGTFRSVNPAATGEVVAEVALGDAKTFAAAARAARAAQAAWSDVPAPVRGRAIAHIGRLVEDNAERAGPAGDQGDRQALRRGARRGPGDRRHLRLLPRRGAQALRPDGAERDARQAAVHLPQPGRGGRA